MLMLPPNDVCVCRVPLKESLHKICLHQGMQLVDFHLNVAIVLVFVTFAFPVSFRCNFPTTRNCFELSAV